MDIRFPRAQSCLSPAIFVRLLIISAVGAAMPFFWTPGLAEMGFHMIFYRTYATFFVFRLQMALKDFLLRSVYEDGICR